ncbi:hypothetical protein CTI12_AA003820 [Artemisia annua]|uniref:Uncharacterized protein n=1 Tax=Artemisia annua TaxID=35608 RepID=A0A2U1QNZ3_ARTAN|nr:hypothetical protein CTI12_AA003820 [Artemisia annua]
MATAPSNYALSRTPNFQELRKAAGSDDLQDSLRLLFAQQNTENDGLLMVWGQQRDALVQKIQKMENLIEEGEGFLPFHAFGELNLEMMKESLESDKKILAALIGLIDVACEAKKEKDFHLLLVE